MKAILLNPENQKKRLRWILLLFFIVLSLPVYYLLQTVYSQLENEAYFTARHQAETLVDQIELNLQQILKTEQNRPIAEYRFFNVMENPLLSETSGVKFSPLSEIPPKTDVKGLVGYFQINTDGSFHLPALPEIGQDSISGLSLAELANRLALKKNLRQLLSIKLTDKTAVPLAQQEKEEADINTQSYIDEFKQQPSVFVEDIASPKPVFKPKKQDIASFSQAPMQETATKAKKKRQYSSQYKTRKETVQLPDQSMASSYFNRAQQLSRFSEAEEVATSDEQIKDSELKANKLSTSAINVLSFETEVTPLQLLLIGQDYFCFYRYIWHDKQRYTQGFIVNRHQFLIAMTKELINNSDFSSIQFNNQGTSLQKINITTIEEEYPLYKRNLSMPFQQLELIINIAQLSNPAGSLLIDLLALSIYSILLMGFIAFYRLAARQMDLARQQQNFISAVSHELKTPLTSIRMYGEMLRSGWVIDETKKQNYYDFIFFESERLSRLIANVLQLARLGHQNHKPEVVSISVHNLLGRISTKVEVQIEASCFQLQLLNTEKQTEQLKIKVDEDAFFQIIINLVDNAIKFSNNAEKKRIDIGFKRSKNNKQAIFSIRDYGPGIKKDQMKKIFQLFYRSGNELTRTTPGTGIGLALVAQLAETMNARISVINKQPGAEFQIKLPII